MLRRIFLPLVGVILTLATAPARSQVPHGHPAQPQEKLGRVVFPISCNAEAQQRFERAVALLHSFWWAEAQKAFDSVVEADAQCAMAYWGKAIVQRGNWFAGAPGAEALQAGATAAERAVALNAPTPRERAYIAAIATLFRDHGDVDHRTRSLAYEEAMKSLHEQHAGDPEAAILYALAVTSNAVSTDKSFERQKRAGAILEPLFERQPDHPGLAHYIIHTYDAPPIAHMGVRAAQQYGQIAPSVPHARHMPSHIFTRLGMWDASIEANLASAAAAREYEEAQKMTAVSFDRAHAWDYLVYGYLQQGRDREAAQILDEVGRATAQPSIATDYAFAAIPARFTLERGQWREAAGLTVRPSPGFRAGEAITHFARGIGAARAGDTVSAAAEVKALAGIRDELQPKDPYWSQVVEAQRLAVGAWIARAQGNREEAVKLLARAAEIEETVDKHPVTPGPILPAWELMGDLLLEMDRPDEALRAYEQALKHEPNRTRSVFGAARAAERLGDTAAARKRYSELVQLMGRAASDRPEVRLARAFLDAHR